MSRWSASPHAAGVSARKPVSPSVIAERNASVGEATVGTPTSAASKYFNSLLASQNGFPCSRGARLMSNRASS